MLLHHPLCQDLFSTAGMRALWSEDETINRWLQTETAIVQSLAQLKLIPANAALKMAQITTQDINRRQLAKDMQLVGRPIKGLVKQLRRLCGNECAPFVHWGASSQDIMDTAMMMQVRDGLVLLRRQLSATIKRTEVMARKCRNIAATTRTNNQYALPGAFGDKANGWFLELCRRRECLADAAARGLTVQLGGAVGLLCADVRERQQVQVRINKLWREELQRRGDALSITPAPASDIYDGKGMQVKKLVAKKLRLPCGEWHWQNARDGIGEVMSALALLATSLRKIARNVNSLSSSDIGELRESFATDKGASSSMAHKQNQRCSEFAEATSQMVMHRAGSIGDSALHDHERSGGAWIAEWSAVPEVFMLSSAALYWSGKMLTDITINPRQITNNLRTMLRQV